MPLFERNESIAIHHEVEGPADGEPMVLIMGFAMQLIAWPDEFRRRLTDAGFRLILLDNRDMGLSCRLEEQAPADEVAQQVTKVVAQRLVGHCAQTPYDLEDMADDVVALLDHLDISAAHIVGASMGGMIAQLIAIHYPDRVSSLCSIMSTTGQRRFGMPAPGVMKLLLSQPGPTREEAIAYGLKFWKLVSSPADPPTDQEVIEQIDLAINRCSDMSGRVRQLVAIASAPSRLPDLKTVEARTVVIHGSADTLIRPAAAKAIAAAIPGAKLAILDGMGHDLRPHFIPRITELIIDNASA